MLEVFPERTRYFRFRKLPEPQTIQHGFEIETALYNTIDQSNIALKSCHLSVWFRETEHMTSRIDQARKSKKQLKNFIKKSKTIRKAIKRTCFIDSIFYWNEAKSQQT